MIGILDIDGRIVTFDKPKKSGHSVTSLYQYVTINHSTTSVTTSDYPPWSTNVWCS